jgi:hypothetical protein
MRAFSITVTGLILLVVTINGLAAWDGRRHHRRFLSLATDLRPGQAVIVSRELDDRRLHRVRLQVIPRPAVVAFGSSRIMPLGGAALGLAPGRFYNAAVSGGSVEDHIAFWQLLKQGGRVPDIAIFSIDHWALAESQEQVRWLALADLVREFLDGSGRRPGVRGVALQTLTYEWARFKELFSYTVLEAALADFQRAMRGRSRRGSEVLEALRRDVVPEDRVGDRRAVRADGSLIYDQAFASHTPEQVRTEAVRSVRTAFRELGDFRIDRERLVRLELLWRDMRTHAVELVVYVPPYHPAAWTLIQTDARAAATLADTAAAVSALSVRMGARFRDAADPDSIPCGAEQFYDGVHVRVECLRALIASLLAEPSPGVGKLPATPRGLALPGHRRFHVGAVGGHVALDDLEVVEHEAQGEEAISE